MRTLTFVLVLLLFSPACERIVPIAQEDAGPVQPSRDAGSATDGGAVSDARVPRLGAGPLDPDLTIPCEVASVHVSKDPVTGEIENRTSYLTATWAEPQLPSEAWVCTPASIPFQSCGALGPDRCEVQGPLQQRKCQTPTWYATETGLLFALCGFRVEADRDGDGDIEPGEPDFFDAYLAIIR